MEREAGVIFITGGARSGKSRFALKLAEERLKDISATEHSAVVTDEVSHESSSTSLSPRLSARRQKVGEGEEENITSPLHPFTPSPPFSLQPLKAYIATAAALDDEMKERIQRHRRERGQGWDTVEEPLDIVKAINDLSGYSVILLDCLTLWISNLMLNGREIENDIERFLNCLRQHLTPSPLHPFISPSTIIIVSNEVGMGIVPENGLARRFRDVAGMVNQKVAEIADEVYLVVSGIPVKIKG